MRLARYFCVGLGLLLAAGPPASAQFGAGYGYYGWGGWGGGGTTVGGSIAQGMGVYAAGLGQYNVDTAQAISINADTAMRWNTYVNSAQAAINRERADRLRREGKQQGEAMDAIQKRIRENPTPGDITSGSALNAMLDDYQDPRVQAEARKLSERVAVPAALVKRIPFFYASDPFSFSLNQFVGGQGRWPDVLRTEEFAADRQRIAELAQKAKAEDDEGQVSQETFDQLYAAAGALHEKFDAKYKPGTPQYVAGEPFLKSLHGFTRLLRNTEFDKVLAQLQADQSTSLSNVLGFMTIFNLRFGAAQTDEHRAAYQQLYPIMAERRQEILALMAQNAPPTNPTAPPQTGEAAPVGDVFHELDVDQVRGRGQPGPPRARPKRQQPPQPQPPR